MPKIIERTHKDIVERLMQSYKLCVSDKEPDLDDPGTALLNIFAHMQEDAINRMNKVPERNFSAFLGMLGVGLMPAQPAKVPVTFYPAEGALGGLFVPAGTQVTSAETASHGTITYETANSFTAISAIIDQVYSLDPAKDVIYNHTDDFKAGKHFRIFESAEGENLQKHSLYIGHSKLFKFTEPGPTNLKVVLEGVGLDNLKFCKWFDGVGNLLEFEPKYPGEEQGSCTVTFCTTKVIEESKVYGISSIWIRCDLENGKVDSVSPLIRKISMVQNEKQINPDQGFYNYLPLDLSKKFYPFGRQPRIYDSFYITSHEAFSKDGAEITITFQRTDNDKSEVKPSEDVEILWEYWNGSFWKALNLKLNNKKEDVGIANFNLVPGTIYALVFPRPNDLSECEVNLVRGYWIRARLVNGNYGRELVTPQPKVSNGVEYVITPDFHPPFMSSIKISYKLEIGSDLEYCLSYNNLEFRDVTALSRGKGDGFRPFIPIPEERPSIYLGFKNPLVKGNLSMFFSIVDKDTTSGIASEIVWSHWTSAPAIEKKESDENGSKLTLVSTEGLSVGMQLVLNEDLEGESASETRKIKKIEGKKICLEKENLDHNYSHKGRILRRIRLEVLDNTGHLSRSGTLEILSPSDHRITRAFGEDRYWLIGALDPAKSIMFEGIYLNTTWSEQAESVKDEILGSSDGEKSMVLRFIRSPVTQPEVWVREGVVISDEEKQALIAEGNAFNEVKDRTGKTVDAWIRWKAVDHFFDSSSKDRHYVLEGATGEIRFGDGKEGMIPPIGRDNIQASYRSGGGVKGNVAKGEISILKTPIAGIDHVTNHLPAEGGSDTETLETALERGPSIMRCRDRAVTLEDFERLAKAASSNVARAKCLVEGSTLKVIVIPRAEDDRPMPSEGLKETVRRYLFERRLNSLSSEDLIVEGPRYLDVNLYAEIIPESIDQVVPLEREIRSRLREFLHPLTGGSEGKGWEFGRDVHRSDIFSLIEGVAGVDHVEALRLNNSDTNDMSVEPSEIICSGELDLKFRLGSKR